MILIIDNYDSFVHNLARYFRQLGLETKVVRNDELGVTEVNKDVSAIVISPGPCTPDDAGCSIELVKKFYDEVPILGVCLGHQAIAQAFGGIIVRANEPMHGRSSSIQHSRSGIFEGLKPNITVGRYHSLVVAPESLPKCFEITATAADGTIMAIRHKDYPVIGVQFHPESILTEMGYTILLNFLSVAEIECKLPDAIPKSEFAGLAGPYI